MLEEASAIVKNFWQNNLIKASELQLSKLEMPSSTKKFMLDTGVPTVAHSQADLYVRFRPYEDFTKRDFNGETFVIVGKDDFNHVAIKALDGSIWFIDTNDSNLATYANSELAYLLAFIAIFNERAIKTSPQRDQLIYDPEKLHEISQLTAASLQREFNHFDSTALLDSESIWSALLDEIELGVV
jgi:SUKH-4 immunity protein